MQRSIETITREQRERIFRQHGNIPAELKALPVWLLWWIRNADPATGKFPKVPAYATTGANRKGEQGSPEDRANLVTFDQALKALPKNKRMAGLGIATLPEHGVTALDFDGCVDKDGNINPEVLRLTANTYAEKSPSGKGIRAFLLGPATDGKNHVDGIEVFHGKGFVTVTGDQIENDYRELGMPLQSVDAAMRETLERMVGAKGRSGEKPAKRHDPIIDALVKAGLYEREMGRGKHSITCPWEDEHSDYGRPGGDGDTYYREAHHDGHDTPLIACSHASHADRNTSDFLTAIGIDDLDGVFASLDRTVNLLRADQITPEAIRWAWNGWLALGKFILLAGSPGTGKTTLAVFMVAVITTGGKWPDGTPCEAGSAVIWSGEDDPKDTLVPRLLACGADLKRVHFVTDAIGPDGPRPFDPARDMALLLSEIQKVGDVRLILVDPIVSAVVGDSHKNAEVRKSLQPAVDLAAKVGAVLLGITHFTKGTAGRDTTERVTGSLAFAALARLVLVTARDAEAGDYLLTRAKSNIGPDGGGFRYHLEQVDIPDHPGLSASRVAWGEAIEGQARELIAEAEGDTKDKDKDKDGGNAVDEWLRNLLSMQAMKAGEVFTLGSSKGYGERMLQRALKRIGGISGKTECRGPSWWRLPGVEIAEGDPFADVDDL